MRKYALRKILLALLAAACCSQLAAQSRAPKDSHRPVTDQNPHRLLSYGRLPLSFEANQGQADERVKFLSHGQGYTLFLRSSEALFGLRHSQAGNESAEVEGIGIKLQGANPQAEIVGVDELAGHVNYFIGNDANHWIKNVPTYAKARYQEIYPGIDLLFYGNEQQLESDFVIAPGSDPNQIRLQFKGGRGLRVSSEGDLILKTSNGELRLLRPHVYQDIEGSRRDVSGNYVPHGARTVSFSIGAYDHAAPLVIDPILVYSTALNGANFAVGNGGGHGIAVDASGNAYVTGYTDRSNFLPTPGAFTTANGLLFVTKINPAGTGVLYTTVFGGTGSDVSMAITLDTQDEPVIAGFTSSADFPTMNPIQTTLPAGTHAFVTKLNAAGSGVLYSTLLGGSGASGVGNAADVANAVTTDANGAVYVTGYTNSVDFPTKNGVQPTCPDLQLNGYCNVHGFVAKLDPTQSGTAAIVYSTYLGGNFPTAGQGIAVDASGNAYVTGTTNATDFATTPGSFQTTLVGGSDAFVSVLNPGGSNFVYSTFLGYGQGWGIAVDGQGNAYVTGATNAFGGSFPVTAGAFQTTLSESTTSDHAFVTKLNPSGTGLVYSTFLGGSGTENINTGNIAIDANGNAYISGLTSSTDFPTTANAIQATFGGPPYDAFVTELNASGSSLIYSTYLGGATGDQAYGLALDATGAVYVMGTTSSANFPTTPGAFEPTVNTGTGSVFVARIGAPLTNTTVSASVNPSVFGQPVSFTATVGSAAPSALTPTGTVTFSDQGTILGTATLSSGTATFNTASLAVGTHNITAVYAGDVNFAPSTSLALTQVVSQAGTTTTVSASPSPSILGQTVMLTANVGGVAPGAGTPTGTVTFLDGATVLGTGSLSSAGISTLSTSSLSSGNHNLTASYGGDPNFTASTSASVTFTVQSSSPATHLVASAPASATAGIAFGVTVTALDTSNNQATSYIDTVTLSSTDAQAGLPAPYTFTASDHGTHVFAVTLNTAGTQTISATDTPNAAITGTSAPISVTSAVPPPVQITDNETIKISDAESFTDPFDAEAVHVADAVFVTPLIAVTAPVAEFSPGGLRFGGQNGTQTITVSNIGGASLTLTSAAVSASIQFSIAQISCSNGTTSLSTVLPSGGACILTINYTASTTPANDTAMLVFNDNAALSNLPTTPSGATYTQSVPLNGGGTNIAPPPPPPATVSVMDNETIHVADAESFPDVFDSETITVSDQVTVKIVSNPTTTSISAAGVTYGTAATTTVSVSSLSGTVAGSVTLSVDGGAPSSISLSNGSAVFNLGVLSAGSHSLSANYVTQGSFSGSSAQTTLVVNQATPTISWANPAPIIFGTALSSTQLNATASVPGSFVYSPAPGTVLTGGIQTLSVAFTPTDTTDYTTATANVTLIVDARPVFTSPNATTFTVGTASSFTVTAMGVPAPALSYSSLPAGVVFNSVTGVLSGAPAPGTGGTYSITFSALNSVGVANQAFTLTVNEAPTITSKSTVTFVVGVAGAFLPTATGFPSPVFVESGALPQGLSFALNVLSGTAVEGTEGTYNITLTANNGVGSAATQKVTLVVIPQSLPAFTSPSSATFGFACSNSTCTNLINALHNSFTVTTTGNPTPKLTVSRLPAGLTFTDNGNGTATLSGSPSFSAHLTFTATGAGGAAFAATQSFTLIVNPLPPPPAFTSPSQAAFAAGQPNTFTVAAAPFIDRITMSSASANFLPPWMVLTDNHDGTATLSGIPDDQPGQMFKITFTASNSGDPNYKVTQAFSLVLLP